MQKGTGTMQAKQIPPLLVALSVALSCGHHDNEHSAERSERQARIAVTPTEKLLGSDAAQTTRLTSEQSIEATFQPRAWVAKVVTKPPPKAPETQLAVEPVVEDVDVVPSLPADLPVQGPRGEMQAQAETHMQSKPAPRGEYSTAVNTALVIGAMSTGLGSVAAASGDGTVNESTFSIVALGIGIVGLTTAWILYTIEPTPKQSSAHHTKTLTIGPTGVRVSF
jgi:hypothetical protein